MPRQRSETVNRQSERHNPISTPQCRNRTDSSQTATSSSSSSRRSTKSLLTNRNNRSNSNSPRKPNFSPGPQLSPFLSSQHLLQQHQHGNRDADPMQVDSISVDPNSINNPPAVLQRTMWGREPRERTSTCGSLTPVTLDGFPTRDSWNQTQEQYLSRIHLKRDKSLTTPSMYHGALYHLCLAKGLDETAEEILSQVGKKHEEEWKAAAISKWGTSSFDLEKIEETNSKSSAKEKSKRYFSLMAGCPVEGWVLVTSNEGKAVVAPDSVFDVLSWCHGKSGHGGRDKTHGLLRKYFANVPKELCQSYVKICPTCESKRHNTMARVKNSEEEDFEYGQDDEMEMNDHSSFSHGGMAGSSHQLKEGGISIDDWNSKASQQREFNGAQFDPLLHLQSNSLGLDTGVPTVAFLPPSPFHSGAQLHQASLQHQHPSAYGQVYDAAQERLVPYFGHTNNRGLTQDVTGAHRGSFSGSSASGGGMGSSACGSGSESNGPNTPASQVDLNWPKDSDVTVTQPFFGDNNQMNHYSHQSNVFDGKDSMSFGFQNQEHIPTNYLTFSDQAHPSSDSGGSESNSKTSMNRQNRPAQLDLSSIHNQVMELEDNFQPYGLPTACSSISTHSEMSVYSAVTEPSIQYRPLLDDSDEAETARISSSELLPRRFNINNPPSSAPSSQTCFFSDRSDDTLREIQEQRSRERAVLAAAAASGKGKHASLHQGFGGDGSNEEFLPSHRVATPLSAVPPTTTASFGPTYGAVFGNVVGGSGNLFSGQVRGKDGKLESALMPVSAYGAPDLTVYLNPAYGIPGMSGESMIKSFSAPGSTSTAQPIESAQQDGSQEAPISKSSKGGNGSHCIPAPPDLLRRHSVAVEQAVVPETSSSLVSIGMTPETGFGPRSIPPQSFRALVESASLEKDRKEKGHGRERARHESFEPLSTASSPSDLKEIAKLNGMTKSQSEQGSLYYDASNMQGPADFTDQLNSNLEINLSLARGIDSSSIPFPQVQVDGNEETSADAVSNEDMMLSFRTVWQAGTDSTVSMISKAKETFLDKASSIGIGLGFPSIHPNEGASSSSSDDDSSRGTIRVLRNSSVQSSQGGRTLSGSSTSSGFQPARARCSSTTKVDKSDVQIALNSVNHGPRSGSTAYGSMRSHSRKVSKQSSSSHKLGDENSNSGFVDPNELMSAEELNELLS